VNVVFLNNLSKREKRILLLTVLVGSLSLTYIMVVEPLFKRFNELNSEIMLKKRKLQKIYALLGHKDKIEAEYEKIIKADVKDASDEEIIANILKQIETSAKDSGVQLSNIRPERIRQEDYYKRLSIEVNAEAPINALFKFIYKLETSPALLKIERLQITPSRRQEGFVESTFIITKISFR